MLNSINIKKLEKSKIQDFSKVIQYLCPTTLSDIDRIVEKINSDKNNSIYVAEIDGELIGTTTITTEPKFIHNAGFVCHFEDIAIIPKYRGKKISEKIINELKDLTKNSCYKIIADSNNLLINAFRSCGFEKTSHSMVFNHGKVKFSDIEKTIKETDANFDFRIRNLEETDLDNGYLEALKRLTVVDIKNDKIKHDRFVDIDSNPNYIIQVGEENGEVVGGTTLYIKPKFLEGGKLVGHIEDVATSKKFKGKDYGKKIVLSLLKMAEELGCVKTVLNCEDALVSWYKSLGFEEDKTGMRYPPKH